MNVHTVKESSGWFKSPSLALRLTAFYTAAGSLMLMISSLIVFAWISKSIRDDDDERLRNKLLSIQSIIQKTPRENLKTAIDAAVGLEIIAESMEPFLIRIKNSRHEIINETPRMDYLMPVGTFDKTEALGVNLLKNPERLVAPSGHEFRAWRLEATAQDSETLSIYGVVDHEPETNLINNYRQTLFIVNIAGCILSAGIGQFIARRGMRPLRQIGDAVLKIRAVNLNQRIDSSHYPREISILAANFNQMLQGLEDAFDRLSRYSADIAHELRTPINNIRGEAEVALNRNRSDEEYRETLGSCLEECQRLSQLIDSLLFIARAENPAVQINRESLAVAEQLEGIVEFYSPLAADCEITLQYSSPANLLCLADKHLLRRAIGNLIENAIKYSPPKSHIRVSAEPIDTGVRFTIADNGKGIPPQHLPHIFNRFYRVDADRSKETGGAGLGLAIVKTIATLHNGNVDIQSTPGQGTTVTIEFKS